MLLPDHIQTEVMEGGYNQPSGEFAIDNPAHSLFHLAGGLVGEGNGGNMAPRNAKVLDQIGNFSGYYAGFATASTGQDKQGAICVAHSFILSRVEFVHEYTAR